MGKVKETESKNSNWDKVNIEELQWYSNCCTAPPIHDLHIDHEYDTQPIGLCMQCREGAVFNIDIGDEENEQD